MNNDMKYSSLKCMIAVLLMGVFSLMGSAKAQNLTVGGRVTDTKGEAMPFVNVALMRPADTVFMRGASTDFDGRFTITGVDSGSYLLQASFVGYTTVYKDLNVLEDMKDLNIQLQQGTTLKEVTVTAEKPLYLMDGEKNMYNTKEDPSIQTGTASDALQNAPGVEVDAEGNITLRGVSSVEIWINDRPSHMNEEALKQYIKQLPANAIERIEVITNPSARYSTSGGVINIVTNQKITRNELLCVGVRSQLSPESRPMVSNLSPWVSYVWANEKVDFNIYLNANYAQHDSKVNGTSTLYDDTGAVRRYREYDIDNHMPYYGGYSGINFNWSIDSMTHLTAWLGGYPYWDKNRYDGTYWNYSYNPYRDSSYTESTRNNGFTGGVYGGAWYEHRFDTAGRKLSVSMYGNYWNNSGYSDVTRDFFDATQTDLHRHLTATQPNPRGTLGVDYTLPLKNNYEMEMGVELWMAHSSSDERLDENGVNLPLRSYRSEGYFWKPEAYVTAQKRWGGFTAKVGLRGESLFRYGNIAHYGEEPLDMKDDLFELVPSLHLSYQTKSFESYSFSYTRRYSNEEDLSKLYDFRMYDDYSYTTGNPLLKVCYTHNIEAAWNKYIMKFGTVGLNGYARINQDEIGTNYAFVDDPVLGPVYFTYPDNISSSHMEGLEANITYRPSAFVNVRFNASLDNYGYSYAGIDTNGLSCSFRLNVWAKLWQKLEVFANARYTSPRLGLYSLSNETKSIDFGCSSDFFDRKLSVYLSINDIFGWTEWGTNTTAPAYQTTGTNKFNSRYISFGLTWRIGKMELESKARQGATDIKS